MKKTFMTILPFAAAVLLATSCGKDDNDSNIVTEQTSTEQPASEQPATEQPADENVNYVKIPFSVKVDDGTSLSKVWYDYAKDADENVIWNKVKREFATYEYEDGGSSQLKLEVTGKESSSGVTKSYLYLTKEDGKFIFSGDITVEEDKVAAFTTAPGVDLVGQFTQEFAGTETPYSSQSLAELMMMVSHTYKAEFKSMGDEISLVDQNAYLAIQWTNPTREKLNIKSPKIKNVAYNSDGRAWVKVATGVAIECPDLDIKESDNKIAQPGYIYTINRVGASAIQIKVGDYPITNGSTITIKKGETLELSCDVTPTNTTERIYWTCHSTWITCSSYDRSCRITATQEGKTTIYAKNNNSEIQASLNLVVLSDDDKCARGVFSVSDTKKVIFSKGNLRYYHSGVSSESHWMIDNYQVNSVSYGSSGQFQHDYYGSIIGHFAWGAWIEGEDPIGGGHSGSDWDAGIPADKQAAIGPDWFVLSTDEWYYLLENTTKRPQSRYLHANIANTKGLILFPDNWISTVDHANEAQGDYIDVDWSTWQNMEAAGAVFLVSNGYFDTKKEDAAGVEISANNESGYYWATKVQEGYTTMYECLSIMSGYVSPSTAYGSRKTDRLSVRLVKEL